MKITHIHSSIQSIHSSGVLQGFFKRSLANDLPKACSTWNSCLLTEQMFGIRDQRMCYSVTGRPDPNYCCSFTENHVSFLPSHVFSSYFPLVWLDPVFHGDSPVLFILVLGL